MEHNVHTAEQAANQKVGEDANGPQAATVPGTSASSAGQQVSPADGGNSAELTAQLEDARREASENHDRYLRVHADMENYKKRIERTYADLSRNSKKDLLLKLLGVKDNLERALSYGGTAEPGQNESIIQGVRLTEYQLDQLLRSEGVTPMDLKGKPFDPKVAEAVSTIVNPKLKDHSVAEIVQQGYLYQDEVLRAAKVVVALRESGEEL
jgi:molecular chaperone GrpE